MILLFIDSKFRDGKSYVNLAKMLNKRDRDGDVPIITTSFDNWQESLRLNPKVVVLNHLIGNRNKEIANYVRSYGGKVAILPTEGRPNNGEIAKWWTESNGDNYDLFMHWNDSLLPESDTRHVVTGCPRFDVYSNGQHNDREHTHALLGLDPNKHTVLIASSFPQAKFAYTHSLFNHNDWKDLSRGDSVANVQSELNEFKIFVNTIDTVVRLKRDWQFIIKPHPMEPSWMWEEFCEENPNCKLVTQMPIEDLVSACDVLVNRAGCITFYDGALAGVKETYTLNLTDRELDGAELEAYAKSNWFGSPGSFIDWICSDLDMNPTMLDTDEIIASHLGQNVGSATWLVCDRLIDLYQESESPGCSFDMLLRFQMKKAQSNSINAYPNIDDLHTGKQITDGSISNYWMAITEKQQ